MHQSFSKCFVQSLGRVLKRRGSAQLPEPHARRGLPIRLLPVSESPPQAPLATAAQTYAATGYPFECLGRQHTRRSHGWGSEPVSESSARTGSGRPVDWPPLAVSVRDQS